MNNNNVDLLIGTKIRLRRHVLGMSQTDLGNRIGVTFQQVQKYEKGHNKIVASRLLEVANIMDVPISDFFEDLNNFRAVNSESNSISFSCSYNF